MSLNTTPATWVTGTVVTAAQLNLEVRDALTGIQAAFTAFTPAWTASTTNPTIGNGTIACRYQRYGKTIPSCEFYLLLGSTTTVGSGNYSLSIPVAAANLLSANVDRGHFWFRDVSATTDYQGFALFANASTMQIRGFAANSLWNAAGPVVPANTDWLSGTICYEAA